MKEITYKNLEDYLKVGESYTDPKIVKIYETMSGEPLGSKIYLKAITFMRTWLFQWEMNTDKEKEIRETVSKLREAGHMEGKIREVIPTGKYLG